MPNRSESHAGASGPAPVVGAPAADAGQRPALPASRAAADPAALESVRRFALATRREPGATLGVLQYWLGT